MNNKQLENLAQFIINEARRLGASDSEVSLSVGKSVDTSVRMGEIEKLQGAQEAGLSFTAYVGKRSVTTSSTDFRRQSLTGLICDTIAMAKESEPDEFAGLVDKEFLAQNIPELDLFDPAAGKLSASQKLALALETEKAALAFDNRITNSDGAGFSDSSWIIVYANSNGFLGSYKASSCSLGVSVIASQNGVMQSDWWYSSGRKLTDLVSPEAIGRTAAKRAVRFLGARKVVSQMVPVVFDPRMASRLLGQFCGAAGGSGIYRRTSFLVDKLEEVVASRQLQIIDNALIPGGLGSRPFDGEGMPATERVIVKDGVLKNYFLNGYAAHKLGMKPNSGRSGNLYIKPGNWSADEIISSIKSGLLLTGVSGPGFNPVTGDYSLGASGLWIENGELAYPVHEITVAGNMLDMFRNIEAIGNDPYRSSTSSPTLKIASMTIGGK